jgi:EAL domain-containing protein (putative c-di-GMP-specific phosphodiesterase class I)
VSINASYRTAESDGMLELLDAVDASRVVIEITEHEAVEEYDRLTQALQRVRERGARVAIDDAGAGFASLRHILLIDPEIIKLDVSLTSGIDSDARRRALATALITFAEEMDIAVVAEGIETALEHAALQALGVRFGQGYFIGRPEPLSD